MGSNESRSYLVRDIADGFSRFSDAPIREQELLVRAVFDCVKELLMGASHGDKVVVSGFGSFHVNKKKPAIGRIRDFKTGKPIEGGQTGLAVRFTPSAHLKKHLGKKGGVNE